MSAFDLPEVTPEIKRQWLRDLQECPVFRDVRGARGIVLPNTAAYVVTDEELPGKVLDALKDGNEIAIAIYRKLTTPEEWAEAERVVELFNSMEVV